ncbi:N-acetylglucosamine-6-phosphate deacetylase [Lactobacillus psittaci DSM 15354]|uniref:N-acetylglucosamine-6-phosphate deacetylase n=1 Tax=Lactobacillus psittaci DSM 15354 TaxID=1122152 RepID=A0A0R1SBV1_9LACO|nr:N-acetylglucosamine-6-phosphate deacetylase [Lactobacillus psittaci DSM 15354]
MGGYLEVDAGKFGRYLRENQKPEGKIVELGAKAVAPGLVDTHIHGLLNEDVMKSDWEGINKISEGLLKAGVTSWLPTTITASSETLTSICEMFKEHRHEETGAKIQGLHFEGPFFTPEHGGAENPKYMIDPDINLFNKWRKASGDLLCKISMAPERQGSADFIRQVVKEGVVVALGHSSSNFEDADDAINAGASMFTHTYNGMNQLSQHEPNIIGAAFSSRLTDCELIADGHHVQIPALRALIQAKGCEHICLITDCMQAGLMPDGDYMLGELPVYVKDGMARLKQGDNLAGSILLLKDAVKNLVDWNLATSEDAIMMASYVPAKSSHILDKCGVIAPDMPADFIVLNPDMTLDATYLDGEKRYQA